jgi:multiple sugar transport system substrate-binding protein
MFMTTPGTRGLFGAPLNRREFLGTAAAAGLAASVLHAHPARAAENAAMGLDTSNWTLDTINKIAGTEQVDTTAECSKVVPLDHAGELTYWYVGPNQASPEMEQKIDTQFWAAFAKTYPNIKVTWQNLGYNDMLNKVRTAAIGNAAPMVARMPIMWGAEFAAKGQLHEFRPEDVGHSSADFWPGALRSCMWQGKTYGIPTNNETVGLLWNAALFKEAGLDPDRAPDSWDDLVAYAKQIKEKTGKLGYGVVARVNGGDTPFRFMPQAWSYGGGALDEADPHPEYKTITIDNAGTKAALQLSYDMYARDKSAPRSALTAIQSDNDNPFVAGQLAMMAGHPNEYAQILDRARLATGADRKVADEVVANMRYGLMPKGPVRRAVVFGGSNVHVFRPEYVDRKFDIDSVRAFIAFLTGPEWATKVVWVGSNPGNLRGFKTIWMQQRLQTIKFLGESTLMLPYGIPFPVVPQSNEIMNIIVPTMMQDALTGRMTVSDAADAAAAKVRQAMQA